MSNYNVKLIIDTFKVIELIASSNKSLNLTEISNALDINKTSLFRILTTLVSIDLIEQIDMDYLLGWRLFEIGQKVLPGRGFKTNTHQILEDLSNVVYETVNLGILINDKILFIDVFESSHTLSANFKIGTQLPSHLTAIGKSILSTWKEDEIKNLFLNKPFERFTPSSVNDIESLITQLRTFNENGWALDDEEYSLGIRCMAAPIKDHTGKTIAGISISGPVTRMTIEKTTNSLSHLLDAAKRISTIIGGSNFFN